MPPNSEDASSGLWVFGYGSLCWHPGFEFENSVTGYIRGYSRKFWQGNTTHRGTENKPGRVVTLVEDKEGCVWGRAFKIRGEEALHYLDNRECKLGGYQVQFTMFYPKDDESKAFPAAIYIATPSNRLWLGDAPLNEMAEQILECKGPSGHNVEYLLRLAKFMHESVPEAIDDHLFNLEFLVRNRIKEENLCLKTLMGDRSPSPPPVNNAQQEEEALAMGPAVVRPDTFQYSSRVPPKKLRCLNI